MIKVKLVLSILMIVHIGCPFKQESSKANKTGVQITVESFSNSVKNESNLTNGSSVAPSPIQDLSSLKVKTKNELIWQGKSGEYEYTWSTQDLILRRNNVSESLFDSMADSDFEFDWKAKAKSGNPGGCFKLGSCSYEIEFRLLSIIGNIISFEEIYSSFDGKMGLGEAQRYTTIDVSKNRAYLYERTEFGSTLRVTTPSPDRIVYMTDLFPDKDVLKSLLENEEFLSALQENELDVNLKSVSELANRIKEQDRVFFRNYNYEIPDDFLTRFTIYDFNENKVWIKLNLPHAKDGHLHTEIILKLPIPPKLENILELAKSLKQGFLMKEGEELFGKNSTKIKYLF